MLDRQDITLIAVDDHRAPRRRLLQITAAAAAVALLVAGGVVLSRRDGRSHLVPSGTVDTNTVPTTPTSLAPTTTVATVPSTTAEVAAGVEHVTVTIDESTPTVEGEVVASTGIANPNHWVGTLTASGQIYVTQEVDGATYLQLTDGQLIDSGITWPDQTGVVVPASTAAIDTPEPDVVLDSNQWAVVECLVDGCSPAFRPGPTAFVWNPIVHAGEYYASNLVSTVQPGRAPVTAWLDCGGECQVFGSDADFLYTLGFHDGNGPAIVIRRFAFADLLAGRSFEPSDEIDALATWPAAPEHTPSLDEVPTLLPPISGGVRREYADSPATLHDYVQTWFGEGVDAPVMTITTNIGQPGLQDGDAVDVAPWDHASFGRTAEGYEVLTLDDPSGAVDIWSHGLTRDDLLAVARSLHPPMTDQPGWGVGQLPAGMSPIHEGWGLGAASRFVTWTADNGANYELWIVQGVASMFTTPWTAAGVITTSLIDMGGAPGVAYELPDGRQAVAWTLFDDITVLLGARDAPGTVDDVVDLARSVVEVDRATWQSATIADVSDGDGCNSMFC